MSAIALRLAGPAAVIGLLVALGLFLTRGAEAEIRQAMLLACAIAFLGSLVGAIPLLKNTSPDPAGASRFLAAMLLRLGAVSLGALAVTLIGPVRLEPFLLWLAAGYLVLLVVDTAFALRAFRSL